MSNNITSCVKCGAAIAETMKFCPSCGKRLEGRSPEFYTKVLGAGLGFFLVAFILLEAVREERVTTATAPRNPHPEQVIDDPQVVNMRQELEKDPENLVKMRIFAGILADKVRNNPGTSTALVFEAIDVLGKILQREPNDPVALLMMADLSFEQRALTKAIDFYERYLKIDGADLGARSRYASALTLVGRFDDSINQLSSVLQSDPNNFPAMAYLAITYARSGNIDKARELSATALKLAPSEDARARFSAFVTSLDGETQEQSVQAGGEVGQSSPSDAGIAAFVQAVKSNPVAGPKFVRYDQGSDGTLKLFFRNFPMQQMPPFAKEKFFGGLKTALEAQGLSSVSRLSFVDDQSGAEMEVVAVR